MREKLSGPPHKREMIFIHRAEDAMANVASIHLPQLGYLEQETRRPENWLVQIGLLPVMPRVGQLGSDSFPGAVPLVAGKHAPIPAGIRAMLIELGLFPAGNSSMSINIGLFPTRRGAMLIYIKVFWAQKSSM